MKSRKNANCVLLTYKLKKEDILLLGYFLDLDTYQIIFIHLQWNLMCYIFTNLLHDGVAEQRVTGLKL